jgi:hypothetical protein
VASRRDIAEESDAHSRGEAREPGRGATWEFVCECDREDCDEHVVLSLAEFERLRERRDLVLAAGHSESSAQRARRMAAALRDDAAALQAQAAQQVERARRNLRWSL